MCFRSTLPSHSTTRRLVADRKTGRDSYCTAKHLPMLAYASVQTTRSFIDSNCVLFSRPLIVAIADPNDNRARGLGSIAFRSIEVDAHSDLAKPDIRRQGRNKHYEREQGD